MTLALGLALEQAGEVLHRRVLARHGDEADEVRFVAQDLGDELAV